MKQRKIRGRSGAAQRASQEAHRPAGLAVRQTAVKLLAAIIDKKTSLDGLLDDKGGHPAFLALDLRDRALLRALLQAALRHRAVIAEKLSQFLQKNLPQGARALEHIFHIGAVQILYLDVPNHAAIDLAVETAKRHPQTLRFTALVNAVLRRLAEEAEAEPIAENAYKNLTDKAALQKFVPAWFWQILAADYGAEKAAAILAMQACPPVLDITVRTEPELWAEKLGGHVLPFGSVRLGSRKITVTDLPGFAEGAWWVQNAAASLPVRLMGALYGQHVADLCAAPGGKTAQLLCAGAKVVAVDISAARLKKLQNNLQRLHLSAEIWQGDLRQLAATKDFSPFDAVLLDAPCSSTGTIRRHPDILWTKNRETISVLAQLQTDFLEAGLALVKTGGFLLFCNCSLAKEEGEHLVERFLQQHKNKVRLLPFTQEEMQALLWQKTKEASAAVAGFLTKQGFLRTTPADLPDHDPQFAGLDGFFAARLEKL